MTEVAVGYVSLVPKFGANFKAGITGELGKAGREGGRIAGGGFSSTFLGVLVGNLATKLVSAITTPIRSAFAGGWNRLMSIEEAETTLSALGLDVEKSMKSVDDAVTGTKFAISDAAGMAGVLGASGIEAGEEMTKWLKLTANAAQFTGREFGDIQMLMTDIVGQGKISGETLNRLPIAASSLADHLGVSQEEVRKLASQGKISADVFEQALSGTLGNLAGEMGTTFGAMSANLKTALNATMAALLEPIRDAAKPIMGALLPVLQGIRDQAKVVGQRMSEWMVPAAERFAEKITELPSLFAQMRDSFTSHLDEMRATIDGAGDSLSGLGGLGETLRTTLGSIFGGLSDAATGFVDGFGGIEPLLESLAGLLPLVTGPVGLLGAALREALGDGAVDMRSFGEVAGQTLRPLIDTVVEVAGVLIGALAQGFAAIIPVALEVGRAVGPLVIQLVQQLAPIIGQLATDLVPPLVGILTELAPIISQAAQTIAPLVSNLIDALAPALSAIIGAIGGLLELLAPVLIPVLELLAAVLVGAVEGAIQGVTLFLEGLRNVIDGIVKFVTAIFNGEWAEAWEALKQIVWGIIQAVGGAIWTWLNVTVLGAIRGGIVRLLAMWRGGWKSVLDFFKNFGTNISKFASDTMSGIVNFFRTGLSNARGAVTSGLNAIRNFFSTILSTVRNLVSSAINAVVSFFRGGLSSASSAVSGGLTRIRTFFSNALAGIRTSVSNGINNVLKFFRELPGKILSVIGNLGNLLKNSGKALLGGFVSGISDGFNRARSAVSDGLTKIRNFFPFSPAKEGPFAGSGYTTHSGRKLMQDFAQGIAAERNAANRILTDALTVTPTLDGLEPGSTSRQPVAGGVGLGTTIAGPLVHVAQMIVRNDDDIRRLSQELQRLIESKLRSMGRVAAGGIA